LPPISANGFPGKRVEPYRAGMIATTLIGGLTQQQNILSHPKKEDYQPKIKNRNGL